MCALRESRWAANGMGARGNRRRRVRHRPPRAAAAAGCTCVAPPAPDRADHRRVRRADPRRKPPQRATCARVIWRDDKTGQQTRREARVVVLAAGAIETPRLSPGCRALARAGVSMRQIDWLAARAPWIWRKRRDGRRPGRVPSSDWRGYFAFGWRTPRSGPKQAIR